MHETLKRYIDFARTSNGISEIKSLASTLNGDIDVENTVHTLQDWLDAVKGNVLASDTLEVRKLFDLSVLGGNSCDDLSSPMVSNSK